MSELFVWQVFESGEWGTIAAGIPGVPGLSPLVVRSRWTAEQLRVVAVAHGRASGLLVRLARFEFVELLEEVTP